MTPEELLKSGDVEGALTALQGAIRKAPADARLRRFLFQLLCVLGQWEKALNQLSVLSEMDAESVLLAQIFRPVLACETLRLEVFAGSRTPLIFGEPEPWIGLLVQANQHAAQGHYSSAAQLQAQAFEAAPAASGSVDGVAFDWLADGDSRLGPVVEAFIDAKYYWIPSHRIARISLSAPSDLRDLIWAPAQFSWANGGQAAGFIPVRYSGSERSADGAIRLSRKTEWQEKAEGFFQGLGQRSLATPERDFPLLEVREIQFGDGTATAAPDPAPATA